MSIQNLKDLNVELKENANYLQKSLNTILQIDVSDDLSMLSEEKLRQVIESNNERIFHIELQNATCRDVLRNQEGDCQTCLNQFF